MDRLINLDNPVFYALNQDHAHFQIGDKNTKFYLPEICPFGATEDGKVCQNLEEIITHHEPFFLFGGDRHEYKNFEYFKEVKCMQMVCKHALPVQINSEIIEIKNHKTQKDLIALVQLMQPGYFREGTLHMGNYFGIYVEGKLVAAAGERIKLNGMTEISAVVTHHEYGGRGYAKELMSYLLNKIFGEDRIAFLHVLETNGHAISIYEKLGFAKRRTISLHLYQRKN
ncbi:MAG: hypothetical protein RLZZ546_3150 [Bacteroidota bacterium]